MIRYFKKHFPERKINSSKGEPFGFDTAGIPPMAIGLLSLDSDNPNDAYKIEDLVKMDKDGHRGTVIEIKQPEFDELKKKYANLQSPAVSQPRGPLDGRLKIHQGPKQRDRRIGREEAAAPAVPVAGSPVPVQPPVTPAPKVQIRKPRLARPGAKALEPVA